MEKQYDIAEEYVKAGKEYLESPFEDAELAVILSILENRHAMLFFFPLEQFVRLHGKQLKIGKFSVQNAQDFENAMMGNNAGYLIHVTVRPENYRIAEQSNKYYLDIQQLGEYKGWAGFEQHYRKIANKGPRAKFFSPFTNWINVHQPWNLTPSDPWKSNKTM